MNALSAVFRFQVQDAFRSRWLLVHTLVYLVITEGLLMATGFSDKALVSLINVVLLLVPLVALVFGVIHHYNSRDYTIWMLTQPIKRKTLFTGLYFGMSIPMILSFAIALFLPFAWHGGLDPERGMRLVSLIGLGSLLTLTCAGVAFGLAVRFADRVKGIGLALFLWLTFALLYDGLVLIGITMFDSWPIEKALLVVMLANPIDLARLILLQLFDAAAMLGTTGAVFTRFFGSATGVMLALTALFIWTATPALNALRLFRRQDF